MKNNNKIAVLLILVFITSLVSTSGAIKVKAATTTSERQTSKSSSSEGGKDKNVVTPSHDSDNTVAVGSGEIYTHGTYDDLSYIQQDDEIIISECDKLATQVVIPPSINGISNILIGNDAFKNCTNLESVFISDSVKYIGYYAFMSCSKLSSIEIPNSVTSIGDGAFYDCYRLTNIEIPNSVTRIEDSTFVDCSLTNIEIPNSVTSIGNWAFWRCNKLINIKIPDSVTSIGEGAFQDCRSLTKIEIPSSVTSIGAKAFVYCSNSLVIYGYLGSCAENYAKANGIKFVPIGGEGVSSTDDSYSYTDRNKFFVFDENTKKPIEGATVTLTKTSNKTDSKGAADFQNLNAGTYNLRITKDGYRDYIFDSYDYLKIDPDFCYLKPISDKNKPYISSVILTDSLTCSKVDILQNEKSYDNKSVDSYTIKINACGDSSSSAAEYSLIQNGSVAFSNNSGIFNITPSKRLNAYMPIYVVVKYKDGKVSDAEKTNLNIYESPFAKGEDGYLGFDTISTKVEDKIPIIGNLNLVMGVKDSPCKFKTDGKVFKLDFGGDPLEFKMFSDMGIKSNLIGTVDGVVDTHTIPGKIIFVPKSRSLCLTVDGKAKFQKQLGDMPFVGEVELGAKNRVEGLTVDLQKGKILWGNENCKISMNPYVQFSVGPGVQDIISVRGFLKGEFKYSIIPQKEQKLDFKASGGIIVQALSYEYNQELVEETYHIIPGDKKLSARNNTEGYSIPNIYDKTKYKLASREYINNPSEWLGDSKKKNNLKADYTNKEVKTLQTNIYPDSKPKMAVVGGKKVMVWLQDNNERTGMNRTMLVYSVYDQKTDTWSQPKAVDDDKTADFYPSIASDGTNLYVAWHNNKTTILNEKEIIDNVAANGEIKVAKFDSSNNVFVGQKALTNNSVLDTQPNVVVDNGKAAVVWISNSVNDIFGTKGTNSILYSEISGSTWTTPKVLIDNQKTITNLSVGYMSGKLTTAFVTDSDNNLQTAQDRELFIIKPGQAVQNITNNQVLDSNPTFSKFNGVTTLFWYSDGNIKYTSDLSAKPSTVFTTSPVGLTDDFQVVTNNSGISNGATITPSTITPFTTNTGKIAILWTKAEDKNNEIYSSIYDDAKKAWSDDVKISNVGSEVMCPNGIFDENGNFMIAFKKTTVNDDNTLGQFDLCTIKVVPSYNLAVDKVTYDDTKVAPNAELPIQVNLTNKGELRVDNVKVEVLDGTNVIVTKTIAKSLKPGESATIDSSFSLPSTISKKNYTVRVTPVNGSEYDLSDNTKDITVGYADLGIKLDKYYVGDHQMVSAKVYNSSYIKSGAVLNVREDTPDGKIIASKAIAPISYGESVTNIFDINSELVNYADSENVKAIYFTVDNVADEIRTGDNSEFIAVDKPSDTPVIDNFMTDIQSPQVQGTKITLITTSSGGKGTLQTKFEINDGTGTKVLKDFSDSKNLEWTPDKAGTYTISATIKDENGKTATKTITYKVDKVLTINTCGIDLASPQTVGTKLTLTTNAEGHGTIQYRFVAVKDGKTLFVRDYNKANTATWTPTEIGNYTLYFKAKDETGKEVIKTMNYAINDIAPKITATNTDLTSPQVPGEAIKLSTSVEKQGNFQYAFIVMKDGKTIFVRNYNTTSTSVWTPTETGTYTIHFKVKNANGLVVDKTVNYVIKDKVDLAITATTTDLTSPQTQGKAIKLSTVAEGKGVLNYRFVVYKGSTLIKVRDYNTTNYTTWTPTEAGTYTLYFKVKDETGREVVKSMPYVVK